MSDPAARAGQGTGAAPLSPAALMVAGSRPVRPARRMDLPGALTGTLATAGLLVVAALPARKEHRCF